MKTIAMFVAVLGLVFGVSMATAEASGPSCSSGGKLAQYKTGKRIGKLIVEQAWLTVGEDPTRFDEVADAVRDAVGTAIDNLASSNPSELVLCRAKGLLDGVCDALGDIQDEVEAVCVLDGTVWGKLSAAIYCDLSIAFDGLDVVGLLPAAPVGICGQNFQEACEDRFTHLATHDPACDGFTVGAFAAVFAESVTNMCIFEVED